jgi:DoxX-like family
MKPKSRVWAGRIMSGLTILFLLVDAVTKVLKLQIAVIGTVDLGYPESEVAGIGAVLLVCLFLYAIPKTSILGAILLTGYLGGAVATHLRVGSPLVGFVLFPVYVGAMVWGGLFLRDSRVRALFSPT